MNASANLPVNWFDVFVVLMLMIGYSRGKKHGMSQESLSVLKWIAVVLLAAIAYEPLGLWISTTLQLGKLASYLIAYSLTAGVVAVLFVFFNRTVGEKLKGSDTFGKAEFYLAMPAGMLRFACIVIALLALLNARYYSTAEVKAMTKYQNENYGSNFFPTLATLQDDVFKRSFVGSQVERHLNFLLIKPTAPSPSRGTPVNARRKEFTW
jgi:uncharacterized membrane protein required for colicin V production